MSDKDALGAFTDFADDPDRSGQLVATCALHIIQDVRDIIAATADGVKDYAEKNDEVDVFFLSVRQVDLALQLVPEADEVKTLNDTSCRREAKKLTETAVKAYATFQAFAVRLTERYPSLRVDLDKAFQSAAHDMLDIEDPEQIIDPKFFMKHLIETRAGQYKKCGMT